MSNIATSIVQSKHLLELGLDPATADMYYLPQVMNEGETLWPIDDGYELDEADLPAWSLSALLEVMPNNDYWEIALWQYRGEQWLCVFDDVEFSNGESKGFIADTPLTAAYEMVVWLLENGLIRKGGSHD